MKYKECLQETGAIVRAAVTNNIYKILTVAARGTEGHSRAFGVPRVGWCGHMRINMGHTRKDLPL